MPFSAMSAMLPMGAASLNLQMTRRLAPEACPSLSRCPVATERPMMLRLRGERGMLAFRPGTDPGAGWETAAAPDLAALAPAGHYLALHVAYSHPVLEVNALPDGYVEAYRAAGLLPFDPVFRWAFTEVGMARWSDLADDPRDVLDLAASYGMRFGLVVSLLDAQGMRSWAAFARPDRELGCDEASVLEMHVRALHRAHCRPTNVTAAEVDALRLLKAGQRLKEIAWTLGITEGAVKQRLKSARAKLDARTGAEAISRASALRLI